ncbi:YidH family protein [Nocardioides acrostichi]|uniref:DUF202 domain-containing protein n=1 Tax=Nocardioides acrostichi TaxID=2784339 RepID=A0A930Y5W3_9ACTN|nr:DUF202 domain-containing protein [Nocardioides acrostichi]MBF4161675.1 DUF202 domain-containing protein [Nocardioides acrostichi]
MGRWPRYVYKTGEEPDYRFSLANERTFLAWIRTALALLAGGVAVRTIASSFTDVEQQVLSGLLIGLGVVCAVAAWWRWARSERAMRTGEPLPASGLTVALALGVVLVAALVLALA